MLESFLDTEEKKRKVETEKERNIKKNTVLCVRKKQLLTPDHESSGEKNF